MGKNRLELRTHVAGEEIREVHIVKEISEGWTRIADGWEALESGEFEKGQSLFSLIGVGLLIQIGWIDQALEVLIARDETKWRRLVDGLGQRSAWRGMRHDAAHFVDRMFTMDRRGNNPETGDVEWHLIDPDLTSGTIRTGDSTINIPELLAALAHFLVESLPHVQDRVLADRNIAMLRNSRWGRP